MLSALDADKLIRRFFLREDAGMGLFGNKENLKIVIPLTGAQSVVRIVEQDGEGTGVIRIYSREDRKEANRRQTVHLLVTKSSLPAPCVIDSEEDPLTGAVLLLEEFIAGSHPIPANMDDVRIAALADAFRALHRVGSDVHITIDGKKAGRYSREALNKMRNRFRALTRWFPGGLDPKGRKLVQDWFTHFQDKLDTISSYSLIHDKPNVGNLIWDPAEDKFVFIDLETITYGYRAKDLVQVCHEVLGDDKQKIEKFLANCFHDLTVEEKEEYKDLEPFFHAYYHLSRCAANCRRLRKDNRGSDSPFAHNALEHWEILLEMASSEE